MGNAKDIILKPISRRDADALVKRVHYSGKVVNNSQLHIGVFYNGKLEGAMQFGPSLDKRKIQGLVTNTQWHEFIELNRMAFSDALPRNSESRALAIAMKLIKQHAPQVKWVITFADATQCGDGTIYRAAGFVLTGINKNLTVQIDKNGKTFSDLALKIKYRKITGSSSITEAQKHFKTSSLKGFQLRYIYFIDKSYRARLTVPELPYSTIQEMGAGMYKGQKHAAEMNGDIAGDQPEKGGSSPTQPLSELSGMGLAPRVVEGS